MSKLLAPQSDSPWMTVDEAATYLRFLDAAGQVDRERFYSWKRRAKPRCYRLGADARCVRFKREDLDAVLVAEDEPKALPRLEFPQRRRS